VTPVVTEDGEAVAFDGDVAVVAQGRNGPRVRSYRYRLPHVDGAEWAVVYLEGDGRFLTHSDYGVYAYRWDAAGGAGADFRAWFADLAEYEAQKKNTYFLSKVSRTEFDLDAAHAWCTKRYREAHPGAKEDDEPWRDEVECAGDLYAFVSRHDLTGDPSWCEDYPAQARAFRDRVLPRLARLIRAQLASEKAASPVEALVAGGISREEAVAFVADHGEGRAWIWARSLSRAATATATEASS